ncbi:MAG: PucR family transcriptional regulator ligand-binding domain-containing protein, partial [Nocardioidaceae bacterium]
MLPTIGDVLAMPATAEGRPRVLAGDDALHRAVRWVHVAPVSGTRRLLLGGELLLTTGVGWPTDVRELEAYVDELVDAEVAGLVLELGDRFTAPPPALVARCRRAGLPLIVLDREVRFVSITEAVHARIIDSQSLQLRERDRIHEVFAELNRRGCSTGFLLDQVARMMRSPVVLEDLNHRALAWSSFDRDPAGYLDGWASRSRRAAQQSAPRPAPYERTTYWHPGGWLRTPVEAHGRSWGRLVAIGCDDIPATGEAVLENAALALSLARLAGDDEWTHSGHRALLDGLVGGSYVGLGDLRAAFDANGFRTEHRTMLAVARRCDDASLDTVLQVVREEGPRLNIDVVCAAWAQAADTSIFLVSTDPALADRDDTVVSLLVGAAGDAAGART